MCKRENIYKLAAISLLLISFNRFALANKIIYVDDDSIGANDGSSWQDAYIYLQDALADANSSEKPVEIRVAQGFYKPDDGIEQIRYNLNSTFHLINGVTLSGGYAGISEIYPDERDIRKYETILSGDLAMNDFAVNDPNNLWNEGDFYYYYSGTKIGLKLSHDFIVVVFKEGLTLEEQEAFVESETNLGPFSERDDILTSQCTRLALKKDLTREEIIQTINRLNQRPEVEYVNPELQHDGLNLILLNRFSVKFIESATEEEIEAFNTANNVEIISQSPHGPNRFLLRMKDPKQRNILNTANFYYNDPITEYSEPDLMTYNPIEPRPRQTSNGANNELSNLFLGNSNKVVFNTANNAYDLRYEPKRLDNSYHVISCTNIDETAILDGFTVTAGNSAYTRYSGSGIYIDNSSPKLINCTFIGNTAYSGGGIYCFINSNPTITNCLISDNTSASYGGGIYIDSSSATILNCTITGNVATQKGGGVYVSHNSHVDITNSILWDNFSENNSQIAITGPSFSVSYCNIQNGQNELLIWESGNIDTDPLFGDPNNGDYHLKSQAGRWDPNTQTWVQDDVTSPCIDTGDPNSPIGLDPFPNGGYINMGAYGGTEQASKSYFGLPVCETIVAGDINGDCKVDESDMAIMMIHWLEDYNPDNVKAINGIVFRVQTDKTLYHYGENVLIDFTVTNNTNKTVHISCYQAPELNLLVQKDETNIWTLVEVFVQFSPGVEISAGETISISHSWDLKDNDGDSVEPGSYYVIGEMFADFEAEVKTPITIVSSN